MPCRNLFPLFPLFYRVFPGTGCREGAGLGSGDVFCPKMKGVVCRSAEEKQWEPDASCTAAAY